MSSSPPPDRTDPVMAWRDTMERVCALVLDAGEDRLARTVPATPDWTARQLLSHVVGLGASVLAGDEPDDHNSEWTQAHVDDRSDASAADLVAEWQGLAGDLEEHMREHGPRPLADVVIHEHDLRGALGEPGAHDAVGLAIVRRWMLPRLEQRLGDQRPLALDGGTWSWGSHGTSIDDAPVLLRADGFDLDRALVTRRTADQLRGWTVRGDVEPYLDAFAWLGPLPTSPPDGA